MEVFRQEVQPHPLAPELENVIAIVSDDPLPLDIPCFSLNDISGIADVIEKAAGAAQKSKGSVTV